ncbi:MAG: hypothetical protein QG608_1034 [Actinomycetota bacterium]|nr:hypothetical protein [Actinomycetota bacterium]
MTVWELMAVLRRRWYVTVSGLMVVLVMAGVVHSLPGTYSSQVDVIFLQPDDGNTYRVVTPGLIGLAGIVGQMANGGQDQVQTVSDDVLLAEEGVEHGYSVRLPNSGGQWANNFERPLLDVQVTGDSPQEVHARLDTVLGKIDADLVDLQDRAKVDPRYRVTTRLSPLNPPVLHNAGSRVRALAGSLLLGIVLALTLAVAVDTWALRRRTAASLP